jgi:hypothetical protein
MEPRPECNKYVMKPLYWERRLGWNGFGGARAGRPDEAAAGSVATAAPGVPRGDVPERAPAVPP